MKVTILGGAGGMGRVAVETAARFGFLDELVVADLNLQQAERLVTAVDPKRAKVRAASVDVSDAAALRRLLEPADVVLNTTGPFYRFGVAVVEAAIDSGTHLLDICDDWEPTLEMLELDQRARAAGVTAVIGMGASPGISNLLAKRAMDELDEVRDVYTAWPLDVGDEGVLEEESLSDNGASAAAVHWMQQISGTVRLFERGDLADRRPIAGVVLDYPGRGRGCGYTVGHPEPLTLTRGGRVRGSSGNLMIGKATTIAWLRSVQSKIDRGAWTVEHAASRVLAPGPLEQAGALVRALTIRGPGSLPPFFAYADGAREGRQVRVGVRLTALPRGMGPATAIPLALGLEQLALGLISDRGVFAPEDVIDVERFMTSFAGYCPPVASGNLMAVDVAGLADDAG